MQSGADLQTKSLKEIFPAVGHVLTYINWNKKSHDKITLEKFENLLKIVPSIAELAREIDVSTYRVCNAFSGSNLHFLELKLKKKYLQIVAENDLTALKESLAAQWGLDKRTISSYFEARHASIYDYKLANMRVSDFLKSVRQLRSSFEHVNSPAAVKSLGKTLDCPVENLTNFFRYTFHTVLTNLICNVSQMSDDAFDKLCRSCEMAFKDLDEDELVLLKHETPQNIPLSKKREADGASSTSKKAKVNPVPASAPENFNFAELFKDLFPPAVPVATTTAKMLTVLSSAIEPARPPETSVIADNNPPWNTLDSFERVWEEFEKGTHAEPNGSNEDFAKSWELK